MHTLPRRAILLPLLLASCGGWERADDTPRRLDPLQYGHLNKLRLNVGLVDTEVQFVPGGPGSGDVSAYAPDPPVSALRRMAQERLVAAGDRARAVFIIRYASLVKNGDVYDGNIDVALDIFGPDNNRIGHVEARAYRRHAGEGNLRSILHDMTRELMNALNVELEYQVRRNLRDWLVEPDAASPQNQTVPAPVERETLAPPRR